MTTQEFLDEMAKGIRVVCGSPSHQKMHELSQDALKITMQINSSYHTPEELRALFALLTGRALKSRAASGEQVFFDIYTESEKKADPAKRDSRKLRLLPEFPLRVNSRGINRASLRSKLGKLA